jgi:hypothetical protein
MGRLLVAVDPGAGIVPGELAEAWNADGEASAAGTARVEAARERDFFPGLVELVVIPLVVNLASSAGYDLLKGLVARLRRRQKDAPPLEVAEVPVGSGDVVIVVRVGGASR